MGASGRQGWCIIPIVALILGLTACSTSPSVAQPSSDVQSADVGNPAAPDGGNGSSGFLGFVSTYHDDIEAVAAIIAAAAAVLLVWVTGGLWGATARLATSTEDLAEGAEGQTAAMEKAHELAEKQFLLEGRQADLLEKRHGLQRLQFFDEHKPKIAIRTIGLKPPNPGEIVFQPTQPLNGELVIVNRGGSDARIAYAVYRFYVTPTDLPMIPPLDDNVVHQIFPELPHTMAAHESHTAQISFAALGPRARYIMLGNPDHLFVMGAVRFEDGLKKERWMGFCWHYEPNPRGEGQFVPITNPAYEYSD